MGFTPQRKQYRLNFEDPDLNGLVVLMRSVSVGRILRIQEMASAAKAAVATAKDTGGEAAGDPAMIRSMVEMTAEAMVEWNLDDEEGNPVPISVDSLMDQEIDFLMSIISAWVEAIAGVSAPLERSSTSGVNALEASIPMETLSSSLAS